MYYTIYKTTNLINGHYYIGKHQTLDPYDNYLGSGNKLKIAFKTYGKFNFSKEVLHIFDNEKEMNDKEIELVTEELVKSKECYNIGIGGQGGPLFKDKTHTAASIEKIKRNHRKPELTEELRYRYGSGRRGKGSLESKPKKSNSPEEFSNKMSNLNKGRIYMKNDKLNTNAFIMPDQLEEFELKGYTKGVIRKLKSCGTPASYERGCRCDSCKKAYSENRKTWKSYKSRK